MTSCALYAIIATIALPAMISGASAEAPLHEYWPNRVAPISLEDSEWLQRLITTPHVDVYGCTLRAAFSAKGVLEISFENSLPQVADKAGSEEIGYIHGDGVLFEDLVFNAQWHPRNPMGVTVLFRSKTDEIFGYSARLFYDYGWNGKINAADASITSEYLTLLRKGQALRREIQVDGLVSGFKRNFPHLDNQEGRYYVIVRIPLLTVREGQFEEVDSLFCALEVPRRALKGRH